MSVKRRLNTLKKHLTEAPILRRPDFDREFELHTDWSAQGLGAVLTQRDDEGNEYVVAYASRSCNKTERNYSSYHGECLAAVWAVSHFRYYLYGRKFTLITDHEPLEWLMTNEKLRGMHARWANILQEYDIYIKHRSGIKNLDADGLSRNPLPSEEDSTGARMDHVQPNESERKSASTCHCNPVSLEVRKTLKLRIVRLTIQKEGIANKNKPPSVDIAQYS